jgi:glycosyltransferase involved in cell wall biosynthesis
MALTASTGGIGRHVASLAPRLVAAGHRVVVYGPTPAGARPALAAVEVRPLRRLVEGDADVVHAHGYKAGGAAAAAGVVRPVPLVVTWHNAVLGAGRTGAAARRLQAGVARAADLTLGASADLVAEAARVGAAHCRLSPVAAPELPAPSRDRAAVRESLGVGDDQVLVLTVGRLAPQKNLGMLLGVAAELRGHPEIVFLVAGEGPEAELLAHRIAADGSRVRLLGARDDVVDLLGAADLALLTSTWEARALVAQEALLAGVPLVSTRVGGIAELVDDAAALVDLGDVDGAAARIAELAGDPVQRADLARAGRAQAQTWPGEDDVAADVLAAYGEAQDLAMGDIPGPVRAGQMRHRRLRLLR